ncbi:MAG: sigma-54 dependent transcriptional regulator [Hyphomicrobiales bacterium]
MKKNPLILFVDDEEHLRNAVSQSLTLADLEHQCFEKAEDAIAMVSRDFDGILITDIRMPEMSGTDLMAQALEIDFDLPVILVTGHGDIKLAVEAMRAGAYDFIEKPFDPQRLVTVAKRALEKRRLTQENRALRKNATNRDLLETRLMGRTPIIEDLRQTIRSVADAGMDITITGATGVGKEMVARIIHETSLRREKPFIVISCAALPDEQFESELFGHEQGAFVGAMRTRVGRFEHARGGTILLDEIDQASSKLQAKLVSVLEQGVIQRLGGSETIDLNVRFIASSKQTLASLAKAGTLRENLYHRLNAVELQVPALEERRQDIPKLFTQLVNEACIKYRRDFISIPTDVLSQLSHQTWSGNVRELKNAADRYVLGLEITPSAHDEKGAGTLSDRMNAFEKQLVSSELTAQNGVLRKTHAALGISRKSLYEKMQKHGIDKEAFRDTK